MLMSYDVNFSTRTLDNAPNTGQEIFSAKFIIISKILCHHGNNII